MGLLLPRIFYDCLQLPFGLSTAHLCPCKILFHLTALPIPTLKAFSFKLAVLFFFFFVYKNLDIQRRYFGFNWSNFPCIHTGFGARFYTPEDLLFFSLTTEHQDLASGSPPALPAHGRLLTILPGGLSGCLCVPPRKQHPSWCFLSSSEDSEYVSWESSKILSVEMQQELHLFCQWRCSRNKIERIFSSAAHFISRFGYFCSQFYSSPVPQTGNYPAISFSPLPSLLQKQSFCIILLPNPSDAFFILYL